MIPVRFARIRNDYSVSCFWEGGYEFLLSWSNVAGSFDLPEWVSYMLLANCASPPSWRWMLHTLAGLDFPLLLVPTRNHG